MKALITVVGGPEIPKNDLAKMIAFAIANQTLVPGLTKVMILHEWDGDMKSIPEYTSYADLVIGCVLKPLN